MPAEGAARDQRLVALPARRARVGVEAEHLSGVRGDDRAERPGEHRRRMDGDAEDRLQQHRPRRLQRLLRPLPPGDAEGHVRAVDRVGLTVGQGHGDVDHRKAERAALHRVAGAGLDGGDVVARHRPALHHLGEGEAGAALARRDDELHVGELAGAAGLLLVAVGGLLALRDRLAVGRCRHHLLDLHAEGVLEPLAQHAQVQGALHADERAAGGGVLASPSAPPSPSASEASAPESLTLSRSDVGREDALGDRRLRAVPGRRLVQIAGGGEAAGGEVLGLDRADDRRPRRPRRGGGCRGGRPA